MGTEIIVSEAMQASYQLSSRVLELIARVLSLPCSNLDTTRTFTGMGGNSLLAVRLSADCRQEGIALLVETIMGCDNIKKLIGLARPVLQPDSCTATTPMQAHEQNSRSDKKTISGPPLTEIQLALIHGTQRHPTRNIISYFETYPSEQVPILRHAWYTVVSMEPIFRTNLDLRDGSHLVEQAEAPFIWKEQTVDSREAYDRALHETPSLLQLAPGQECESMWGNRYDVVTLDLKGRAASTQGSISTIVWRIHHALIDGYSATLVLQKVRRVAAGLAVQPSPSFTTLVEELGQLQSSSQEAAKEFWKQQYARYGSTGGELQLPPQQDSNKEDGIGAISFQMPGEVQSQAQAAGVTTATMCYAAWALALSVFIDSETVVFGAVLSGRNLPLDNVETTIGPLVNTLPIHVPLDPTQTVAQMLQQVFRQLVKLSTFQWTLPEHGYDRKFTSALSMQLEPTRIDVDGAVVQPLTPPYSRSETDFPLSIFIETDGTVRVQYDRSMFPSSMVELISSHYQQAFTLLCDLNATVQHCLGGLLTPETRQTLLHLGNCISPLTTFSAVKDDLVSLFMRNVSEHGDQIALQRGKHNMTYAELHEASSKVARQLFKDVKPGDPVCLHADQSLEWIIGIYGILFAGGVYCPLHANLPQDLRNQYADTAGATVFLVPRLHQMHLKPAGCTLAISVEDCIHSTGQECPTISPLSTRQPNAQANAYICFTSGSTGKPKGVICTHAGLVAFQRDRTVRLMARPGWRVAQTMSPAFDGSIHEIFSALSYGATLVLPHSADPFLHLANVDSCILTPSVANVLDPTRFPTLQTVYLVGEPVPQAVNDRWSQQKGLYNMYGPTEGTGGATIKRLLPKYPVTIGRPNPSTRIYILNQRQTLLPPGITGEIWLAGVQVARGYIGLPEQTADLFRPDPVCPDSGEMMYRTGDYGYWDVRSGEIVCLGRKDRQIKLRGFRLDLNDLEIRMLKLHSSTTAVAIAPNWEGNYLVAMVTPASVDTGMLETLARLRLPPHGLPRYIIATDGFPMTSAGKLDYQSVAKALPETVPQPTAQQTDSLPLSTGTEKRVARLWRAVLGLDLSKAITRSSDFFDLGGHSVQQLHLASRLTEEFQLRIPFKVVVECLTVQEMAEQIDRLLTLNARTSLKDTFNRPAGQVDEHQLAPIELEWWHKYQLGEEGTSAFNVCFAARFDPGRVDRHRLTAAWNTVLGRHMILRSRYVSDRRAGVRRRFANSPPQVHRVSHMDLWKEVNRPFLLAQNDPIRVLISRDVLLVVISHIVCDLTTLELLQGEVAGAYHGESSLRTSPRANYMHVMAHNSIYASCDLEFWSEYMAGVPDPARDSFAVGSERTSYGGTSTVFPIPPLLAGQMLRVAHEHRLSSHQLALAAVALTMQAGEPNTAIDLLLGGPHLNRKTPEAQEAIGLFLEPLPIRVREPVPSPVHTGQFLQAVRDSSQRALGHAVPWNQLLCRLSATQDYPNHPLFDTMVTFHDNRKKVPFPLPGFEPVGLWAEGAKFKLLFEFCMESDQDLTVRVEHDRDCYPDVVVNRIVAVLLYGLQLLGEEISFPALRAQLAARVEV